MSLLAMFEKLDAVIPAGMTVFQMESFVINEQLTPYKKIRQCIIEARGRLETKTMMEFDIRELDIELKQNLKHRPLEATRPEEFELSVVKAERLEYQKSRKLRQIEFVEREITFFLTTAEALIAANFNNVEELAALMSSESFIDSQERQYWIERLSRTALTDVQQYETGISKGTLEAILDLPTDDRTTCMQMFESKQYDARNEVRINRDLVLADKA